MDAKISRIPSLTGNSAVAPAPAITIVDITNLIGNANKENPLTTQQESGLKDLCKQYLDVGDGQHTQPESEKRTDELLDLALRFWLKGNSYVAVEIMDAVYPYARVYYGHVETERNYYINSQDKDAFFESITTRANRGCKVAQYAVGKRLVENKDYAQAAEYLQKSFEQGYVPAAEILKQMPATGQPLAESTSRPIKLTLFLEEVEKLTKKIESPVKKNQHPEANFQLGMLWYRQSAHNYFPKARGECEAHLNLAAEEGHMNAAYQLCVLYEANFFGSEKQNLSAVYRQRAFELHHPVAVLEHDAKANPEKLFGLFKLYSAGEYQGITITPDDNKAGHYLLLAADLNHLDALNIVINLINANKLNLPPDRLEHYKELFCKVAITEKSSDYECAVIAKRAGRTELAAQLFLQVAREGKKDSGKAMIVLGQFCDAVHDANGAIKRHLVKKAREENVCAMIGLGDSFRKSGKSEEAMRYYDMALEKNDDAFNKRIHMNMARLYDDQYQKTLFFGKSELLNKAIKHYELSESDEAKIPLLLLKAERGDPDALLEAATFLSSTAPFNEGPAYKNKIERYLLAALAKGHRIKASVLLFTLHEKHFFPGDGYSTSERWAKLYLRKITEAASGSEHKLKMSAIEALTQLAAAEPPHRLLPPEIKNQYGPARQEAIR